MKLIKSGRTEWQKLLLSIYFSHLAKKEAFVKVRDVICQSRAYHVLI